MGTNLKKTLNPAAKKEAAGCPELERKKYHLDRGARVRREGLRIASRKNYGQCLRQRR